MTDRSLGGVDTFIRHVRETAAYRALFSWTTTLSVHLSSRIALKEIRGNKPRLWEQAMLYLLSRLAPRKGG